MHHCGEPQQSLSSTYTSLMQPSGAVSEKNVLYWYNCANVGNLIAIEMSTFESALQQESDTRTLAALAKVIMPHESAEKKNCGIVDK